MALRVHVEVEVDLWDVLGYESTWQSEAELAGKLSTHGEFAFH